MKKLYIILFNFFLMLGLVSSILPELAAQKSTGAATKGKRKTSKKRRKNKKKRNRRKRKKRTRKPKKRLATRKVVEEGSRELTIPEKTEVLTKEISLFERGIQSTLLTQAQKTHVDTKLLPVLRAELAGLTTQTQINAATALPSDQQKITALQNLIQGSAGKTFDAATQEHFALALQDLVDNVEKLDPAILANLGRLLTQAGATPLLSPEQQQIVRLDILPTLGPITVDTIQQIMATGTPAEKLARLQALMDRATPPIDPAIQNAYAQALQQLQGQLPQMDPATKAKFATLLADAVASPLLNPAQQQFVQQQMLPNVVDLTPQGLQQALAQAKTPEERMQILQGYMDAAKASGKPIPAELQNAFAQELQKLQTQLPQMDPATRGDFAHLLQEAAHSPMLNPAQQQFVEKQMLPNAVDLTPQGLQQALAQAKTPQERMQILKTYMDAAKASGKPIPAELQNAFAQELQKLQGELPKMDQAARNQFAELLGEAATNPMLNPAQQQFVEKQMLPNAVDLTPQGLQRALAQAKTPEERMQILKTYMDAAKASGQPIPPALQNAFAQELQKLQQELPNMDPAARNEFAELLGEATTSPMLNPAQQQFVGKQMLPNVVDLTPQGLQQALAQARTPEERMQILKTYMDAAKASGKPIPAELQNAFAQELQKLQTQLPQMDPATRNEFAQLLGQAAHSPMLNPAQQQFVQKQMLPNAVDLTPQGLQQALAQAKTPEERMQILRNYMDAARASGLPIPAELQNAFAQELQNLQNQAGQMDPATRAQLAGLLSDASHSSMLNPAQQQFVQQRMLPNVVDLTPQGLQQALAQAKTPQERMQILRTYMDAAKASGKPIPAELQNAFAQELQNLQNQVGQMDPATRNQFAQLLGEATTNPMLNPAQQQFVGKQMLPNVVDLTPQGLQQALAQAKTPQERMQILKTYMDAAKASGKPIPAELQNAFAQELQQLQAQLPQMDPATRNQFAQLLGQAAQSPLLNPAQQQFVQKQMLPNAVDLTPQGLQQALAQAKTPQERMQILRNYMDAARASGLPIPAELQNAFAQELQSLQNQAGQMDPATRAQLAGLLSDASHSPMLNPAQQQFVQQRMLPNVVDLTPQGLQQALAQAKTPEERMQILRSYMDAARASGKPIPPALQNAFAQELQNLQNQAGQMDPATRAQLATLMSQAAENPILSPAQQKFVQEKMIPNVIDLTPQGLQQALAQAKTPQERMQILRAYMDAAKASGKPIPAELQNAFAQELQQLQGQVAQMDPATRNQFAQLLGDAAQNPLLNPAQRQFVQQQMLPNVIDLSPQGLQQALAQARTPEERMQILRNYMEAAKASGKPIPAELQNIFAKELQQLQGQVEQMDPATRARFATLLNDAGQSPLLNPAQQQFVQEKMLPNVIDLTPKGLQQALAQARTPEERMQILRAYMDAAKASGKPIPAELQNIFAKELQQLQGQMDQMDPLTRTRFTTLLNDAGQSPILSPAQQKFVQEKMLPNVIDLTPQGLQQALAQARTPQERMQILKSYMDAAKASGKPIPADLQNLFAQELQQLQGQVAQMDPATRSQFASLLGEAADSQILSPAQRQFVQQQMLPNEIDLSPQGLQQALAQARTPQERLQILRNYMNAAKASGKPIPADLQNLFAQELQQLQGQVGQMDPATRAQFATLLNDAGQSPLLNPAQQQFVKEKMIPNVIDLSPKGLQQALAQARTPEERMQILRAYMDAAKASGKPIPAELQNIFAKELQQLQGQADQMDPATRTRFAELLGQVAQNPILSPAQQKFIQERMLPNVIDLSPQGLQKALAQARTPEERMQILRSYMDAAKASGKPIPADLQNIFAQELQQLQGQLPQMDPKLKAQFAELLGQATQSQILSPAQRQFVQQQLLPNVVDLTPQGLQQALAQAKNPEDRMRILQMYMDAAKASGKPIPAELQNAFAQELQQLGKQAKELTPDLQAKFATLLGEAEKTPLLSPAQQKFVQKELVPNLQAQLQELTPNLDPKSAALFSGLDNLLAQAGKKGVSPDIQVAFYNRLVEAFNNRPAGNKPYLKALKTILQKALKTKFLSGNQKTQVRAMLQILNLELGTSGKGRKGRSRRSSKRSRSGKGKKGKGKRKGKKKKVSTAKKIAQLEKLLQNPNLTPEQRAKLLSQLTKLAGNVKGANNIARVQALIAAAQQSAALTPEEKAQLAQLAQQLETKAKQAQAAQEKKEDTFKKLYKQLEELIENARTRTLPKAQQDNAKLVERLFAIRPKDKRTLMLLDPLLVKLNKTSIVSDTFKQRVANMIDQVRGEIRKADNLLANK